MPDAMQFCPTACGASKMSVALSLFVSERARFRRTYRREAQVRIGCVVQKHSDGLLVPSIAGDPQCTPSVLVLSMSNTTQVSASSHHSSARSASRSGRQTDLHRAGARIWLGSKAQQELDDIRNALSGRLHQWRDAFGVAAVDVGLAIDEKLRHLGTTSHAKQRASKLHDRGSLSSFLASSRIAREREREREREATPYSIFDIQRSRSA